MRFDAVYGLDEARRDIHPVKILVGGQADDGEAWWEDGLVKLRNGATNEIGTFTLGKIEGNSFFKVIPTIREI